MNAPAPLSPLVFFGTPGFSVPTLDALADAGRAPIAVVSQPARRAGRGRRASQPPVAEWALERGVPLLQPERVKDPGFLDELRELAPAVAVVVAFGQIFPQRLLDLPAQGCVNLHASLLPAHRGASPISAAIAAGDEVTGVTTMRMERGLDSGPVLLQREEPIRADDTTGSLAVRLAALGGALVVETLERMERGELEPREQDASAATLAPRLLKSDGEIDWRRTAAAIERHVRAMTPWPGARTELRGAPLAVLAASLPRPGEADAARRPSGSGAEGAAEVGRIEGVAGEALVVATGGGSLWLDRVQRPGRRPMSGRDLWNGEGPLAGERLGDLSVPRGAAASGGE